MPISGTKLQRNHFFLDDIVPGMANLSRQFKPVLEDVQFHGRGEFRKKETTLIIKEICLHPKQ